jgi:methyl-accepting chemotaxis protein
VSTEAGAKEVSTGIAVVDQAGEAFRRIQSAVDEAARHIGLVSEQSRQIAEQSKAAVETIRSIDKVAELAAAGTMDVSAQVEEQHASMEEIVSSAALLSAMAEELQSRIGRFRV